MAKLPKHDDNAHAVPPSDKTKFLASVLACKARIDDLPPGWRPAYANAMDTLQALDCPQRAEVTLAGPFVECGKISFLHSGSDHCVEGALRRTTARLLARCESCGHAAKRRRLGIETRSLCPECFAPRSLRIEIHNLLGRLRTAVAAEARFRVTTLPVSPLIEAVLDTPDWHKAGCRRRADGKLDVPVGVLLRAEGTLRAVLQALEAIVHEHEAQATDPREDAHAA
jgi:hypothetical protein